MKRFTLTKPEAIKVISFNRIKTGGYEILQFYVSRNTLEIYFNIGLTVDSKAKVKVDIINIEDADYWFSADFDDFILAMNIYDADLTIEIDAGIGLTITDGMRGSLTSIIQYEVKPVEPWPAITPTGFIITKSLVDVLKPFAAALRVGRSCDSILLEEGHIKTSDVAMVADIPFSISGKTCLPIKVVPLLSQFIDFSLYGTSSGGFILQSANYQFYFDNGEPPDYPTPSEIEGVLPDSSNSHKLSIKTADLKKALANFSFNPSVWRWGQIRFNYDPTKLKLFFGCSSGSHRDFCEVINLGATDYGEYWIPTKYIKAVLPLFEENFTLTYNSGNPRVPHQQAVLIESGDFTLVVCKMIMSTR